MPSSRGAFNNQLKSSLVQVEMERHCCLRSELTAFLHLRGSVVISQGKAVLQVTAENAALARYLFRLFKLLGNIAPQIVYRRENRLPYSHFIVQVEEVQEAYQLLQALNMENSFSEEITLPLSELDHLSRCCKRSYLKGAFMAAGNMSDPASGYHLEIHSEYQAYAERLRKVMGDFHLQATVRQRKNGYYTYLKQADALIEFLRVIGAHPTLLQLENQRVLKSMRNQVNRMVNCETANLDKSLQASRSQLEVIEKLDRLLGLDNLPSSLGEAAELRLKNPEASLKELGEMLDPPVGKSGMNHRFRKMQRLTKQLEASQNLG